MVRDLFVIAVSDDGGHILLASRGDAARPTHRLPVDNRLRAALRGTLPPPGGTQAAESALTPREIQARLRAGETPEEVARIAGVPVTRVLRYAGPVISERERVVDEARAAVLTRPRHGPSAHRLGESIDLHLAATPGLRAESVEWGAHRREDGNWVVRLGFTARGRARTAEWLWSPAARIVSALDPLAVKLGHTTAVPPVPVERKPAPAHQPARKAARKPAPRTARKPAPKPARDDLVAAPQKAGVRPAADGKRPSVPSWDDVLLGTREATPAAARVRQAGTRRGSRR